ncbi:MAG: alpha/beta hydrolase [Rhodospirillales bacterium]|nr:alpha/beta hydrolase [Rhodospirillales bacterium]
MADIHPQMQAIIARASATSLPPLMSLTPEAARAQDATHFDAFWNADAPALPSVTDHRVAGAEAPIRMRLYDPGMAKPGPCLVYFHGGGWVLGGLDSHDRVCRELALAGEVLVVSIAYRLAPEHKFPRPLLDCIAAIHWIAAEGVSLGIDPGHLAIGGDSAGGNLALSTLIAIRDAQGPVIRAGLLVYGMFAADPESRSQRQFGDGRYLLSTEETEWFWRCYLSSDAERLDPRAVPILANLEDLPPLYVAAAELDPLLDDSLRLVERLRAAGRPHVFHLWPGVAHGAFQMTRMLEPMRGHIAEIGTFLKSVLRE